MEENHLALRPGFQLDHFRIVAVLGKGGFGITYLALDLRLGKKVAIKELLPDSIATRIHGATVKPQSRALESDWQWARDRFLDEARMLAGFSHPALVGVHSFLESNGTVYMVMDYVEGESYEARLRRIGREPDQTSLMAVMGPILDGLEEVHAKGLLHRDIKPENILINARGQPVLIDFGSARESVGKTMVMTSIVTHGYSPIEQYQAKGKMGPWTDIYAMGAVMCRAMTGNKPPVAADRLMDDDFVWLSYRETSGFSDTLKEAVDWSLCIRPEERPQSVTVFAAQLRSGASFRASQASEKASTRYQSPAVLEPSSLEPVCELPDDRSGNSSRPKWLIPTIASAVIALLLLSAGTLMLLNQTAKQYADPLAIDAAQKRSHKDTSAADAAREKSEAEQRVAQEQKKSEEKAITESRKQKFAELFSRANELQASGSPAEALNALQEALDIQPDNVDLLARAAALHEQLGQTELAQAAWQKLVDLGDDAGKFFDIAEVRLKLLQDSATGDRSVLRDKTGLQPGSTLGIVDLKLKDSRTLTAPTKDLRLAVKARPGEAIDGRDVRINVTFYETLNGEVVPTFSRVQSMWFTSPVDWKGYGVEILEVKYDVPLVGSDGGPPPKFYGYMVNIYHRGLLQETFADPADLQELFQPPLKDKDFPAENSR